MNDSSMKNRTYLTSRAVTFRVGKVLRVRFIALLREIHVLRRVTIIKRIIIVVITTVA